MRPFIKVVVAIALTVYQLPVSAQKNYSIEEAVLGLATNLRVEDIPQLGFRPGTNKIVQVAQGAYLLSKDVNNDKTDTLLSLEDINQGLDDKSKLKSLPPFRFLSKDEVYYTIKNTYYLARFSGKKRDISPYFTLDDKATNVTFDKSHHIAYTIDNNLYIRKNGGNQVAVTNDADPDIINGQSVHRNEFGINGGIFFSPKGNYLAYYRMDQTMVNDYPVINWSDNPAANTNIKYPMAGGTSHQVTLGIYDIARQKTVFINTGSPKDQYLTCVTWDPGEAYVYIAVLDREQNHLKLNKYSAQTGDFVATLFEEKSDKYVEPQHPLYFLPGDKEFIWWSQRDGYMHLYRYDVSGRLINQVTRGNWVVESIDGIDKEAHKLILTTTKGDPRSTAILSVNYESGATKELSSIKGQHQAIVSEDGSYYFDIYRNEETPKNIELVHTASGKYKELLIARNPLANYNNAIVKDVELNADDGTPLYGKIMLPYNFDPKKKYPVIVYLYNGPHVQLITNSFPASGNLWYDYMTQQGFIIFSMDGRGSANRGLDFEQATHNQLGTVEMQDQLKGIEYLKSLPYADIDRLGVHGWSFGGFMTTSLMTRHPGVFKVGVAGGPVIDWSKYEIMYTERYMSSPQNNPEGYKNNNLLNYAKSLKGKLLMIHGTDDDVVVWQHSVQFLKKCVDEKVQLDYFIYPGHPHNVRGKDRVHLMQKISDYFIEHL